MTNLFFILDKTCAELWKIPKKLFFSILLTSRISESSESKPKAVRAAYDKIVVRKIINLKYDYLP